MKGIKHLIAGSALLMSVGTALADDISGNVTIATDYRFRGISQGDRSPAIQGGFDYAAESGFYAGVWASNVTFSGAAIEMDYYTGFSGQVNDDLGYDVGLLWYNYPEDDSPTDLDYYEVYGSLSYGDGTIGVNYSPDYFASTGKFAYIYGDYGWTLPGDVSLGAHLGWNLFEGDKEFASFIAPSPGDNPGKDYLDWNISLTKTMYGVDWGLSYVDTDLSNGECFGGTKLCEATAVFSVTKSL